MWQVGKSADDCNGPKGPDFAIDTDERQSIQVKIAVSQSLLCVQAGMDRIVNKSRLNSVN